MSPAARAHRPLQAVGVGCSFAARGLHSVLLPWLLISASGASGAELGQVQGAALAAQAGALLLLGGLGARLGARRLAVAGQLAAALPPAILALAGPSPSLGSLLAYALGSAALWGVLSPARDALAARGSEGNLLRPTSGFTAAQFSGLLAGIALGAAAERAGAPALLAVQALLHGAAAVALGAGRGLRLRAAPARPTTGERAPRRSGLELVLLTALFGATSAGPFAVWAPLLAAERSDAPARTLGLLLALFPLGTIAASLALRSAGAALSKRRALRVAHAAASLSIAGAGLAPALPLCVACVALWGACGGVFINCGRALLLELRTPEQHGRTLAQLQLALLLASPVGALLGGAAASALGARGSMALLGALGFAGAVAVAAAAGRARRGAPRFASATGSS
jgi:MFS family permease